MITSSLITPLLVLSLSTSSESLESLRADYGSVRGTLEDYSSALLGRADPSPLLPSTHLALSSGLIVGLSTENRELSKTVVLSESASALASLTQLGISLWMPASDLKLGALKFSEFYAWGFQAVGQFFYGRQLIEAGLNNDDASTGRRLEQRGELHQNLSWMTALWGFQSTFLRSWTRYAELEAELKRLDETPESNADYLSAKRQHALKVERRFRQLIVDDLQLRGTIEVALASAASALVALKAPSDKQAGYFAVTGLGLGAGLYKLVSSWTMTAPNTRVPGNPALNAQVVPLPGGLALSVAGNF